MLETKVPNKIAKEMERAIYDSFAAVENEKVELKFDSVNKKDLEQLQFEESRQKLGNFLLFKSSKMKHTMIDFFNSMKTIKFEKG